MRFARGFSLVEVVLARSKKNGTWIETRVLGGIGGQMDSVTYQRRPPRRDKVCLNILEGVEVRGRD